MDEGRGRVDAADGLHARGHLVGVVEPLRAGLEDQQVRAPGDDPIPDPVLEAGHHREHDDERGDAEEDAAQADPDEEREVRALPARPQIAEAEEELEGQPALHRPPSGRSSGNRIVSRIDG